MEHTSQRPVGVFDSGLGGLSVLREALFQLPRENYVYFGDNKNAPYGDKDEQEITRLAFAGARLLMQHSIKALVVACNTATSAAIRDIRRELSIPVVSMEPAIKPACALPGTGKVLMCATLATTRLERYQALQARMCNPGRVINVPCSGLAARIEEGDFAPEGYQGLLRGWLGPYDRTPVDAIVLGCTHYVIIREAFARYARQHWGKDVPVIDGNAATVRQLERVLHREGLANPWGQGRVRFLTSGNRDKLLPLYERIMAGRGTPEAP